MPRAHSAFSSKDEGALITQEPTLHPNYLVNLLVPAAGLHAEDYRGDVYEHRPSSAAMRWEKETLDQPYLSMIRRSAKAFPDLLRLISWMETTTTPSRYYYLSNQESERAQRAHRVRVCQVDLERGKSPSFKHLSDTVQLSEALSSESAANPGPAARIFVVEDLSRDVIEKLGSTFEIDPHFFGAHIDDHILYNASSGVVQPTTLDLVTRMRPYFTVQYLRTRYYRSISSLAEAARDAGNFNVLRQIDTDRARNTIKDAKDGVSALMRAKMSFWAREARTEDETAIAILLIDPTPREGYPLWGGYTSFENWSANEMHVKSLEHPRGSLYADVLFWMSRMTDADIDAIGEDPKACVRPAVWLIASDWRLLLQYITYQLRYIEYEISTPAMRKPGGGIDVTMQKLHTWHRNVPLFRSMVAQTMERIFSPDLQRRHRQHTLDESHGLPALLKDFDIISRDIDSIQTRIERNISVTAALTSIEEGRQAMEHNRSVTRLIYLATIFIPLTFVSGLLSMTPDVSMLKETFWIYFAIAVPLTLTALVVADFLRIQRKIGQLISAGMKRPT